MIKKKKEIKNQNMFLSELKFEAHLGEVENYYKKVLKLS